MTAQNRLTPKKSQLLKPRRKPSGIADWVQVTRPKAKWSDLVLPAAQSKILQSIVAQAKAGATVSSGGSALFAGADGAGKTLAAEVVASALGRPLHRVDLTAVASKYIGETEKNLRQLYDAAEASGAILYFDEADALFGKRSGVKDSHDRYANLELNSLLQHVAASKSLTILATNNKTNLDPAFTRRLRFVVAFPTPPPAPRKARSKTA